MVKIKKGNLVAVVPYSTFKNHYEKLGWRVRVNRASKIEPVENQEDIVTETVVQDTADSEVSLNDMNLNELKEFAAQNGINISEATTKKEIRAIIEAAIDI